MRNLKFAAIFATGGFLLSFICGLLSRSTFLHKFITALICGIILGILGFLAEFIFSKFLLEEAPGDMNIESSGNNQPEQKIGQNVDLTIQDEELSSSGSENHFSVGQNHQMLNSSDYKHDISSPNSAGDSVEKVQNADNIETSDIKENNGFVPLRNIETATNVSGTEAVAPSAVGNGKSDEELDVLPDMVDLNFAENNSEANESEAETDDGGFGSSFATTVHRDSDEPPVDVKDAPIMAKAISSLLSSEES